ncbi:hypothetical protein BD410DRAFT_281993 [Rickenella mellea]|uniref:Uncharacterized protein n=1 Tax=Rickenella mellea TaxID=50990 RepID=A0A4Y7Q3N9_9AGAM|nr:hypothetical protein BD410DRAFT_281993 [Rickenella mellea]
MNPHTSEHVDECDAEQLTSSSTSYAARTELMETNGAAMTVSTSAMSRVPSRATNTKDDQGSQTANPESDEKVLQSKDIADSGEPPHDTGSTDQLVQPRTEQTKSYNYRKEPDPHEVALKEVMQIFRDAGVPEFSDVEEDPSSDRWSPRVMSKSNPTTTFTAVHHAMVA